MRFLVWFARYIGPLQFMLSVDASITLVWVMVRADHDMDPLAVCLQCVSICGMWLLTIRYHQHVRQEETP